MSDENPYVFPDKPAYGVPESVDYTLLNKIDVPDEPYAFAELGDGPGFDSEDELPESDYSDDGDWTNDQ